MLGRGSRASVLLCRMSYCTSERFECVPACPFCKEMNSGSTSVQRKEVAGPQASTSVSNLYTRTRTHTHWHTHVCMWVCMYIRSYCMCIYYIICINTHPHAHRHTQRHTDTLTYQDSSAELSWSSNEGWHRLRTWLLGPMSVWCSSRLKPTESRRIKEASAVGVRGYKRAGYWQ